MEVYNIVEQSILSYFEEEVQLLKSEKFQYIIQALEQLLDKIKNIYTFLNDINLKISDFNKIIGFNEKVSPLLYYIYNMRDFPYLEEQRQRLQQELFKSSILAYERLNEIRTLLTKEKISYQIAAGSKSTKKEYIAQGNFTFAQIEQTLYLQRRTGQYSIRLKINQSELKKLAEKEGVKLKQISFATNPSTLYSAVFRWYTGTRLGRKGKGNWGNFYQAYRYLYYKYDRDNTVNPSQADLEESFEAVLGGGGQEGSFIKGADQGLEQDKASFGNNPSLTSVSTIINILQDMIITLKEFLKTKDSQGLEELLIRKNIDTKIQEKAREEAIQAIKNFTKDFS